jgi:hypothetical protein
MLSLVPNIIPRNLCKKSPDAARMSFTITTTRCLYISCVCDSTMLRDLIDPPTTSPHVLSMCARLFTEIECDAAGNVIGVQYATPRPQHDLIPWSLDHVIPHPSHLIIIVLHIYIIIFVQVLCQSLEPIAQNSHIYPSLPYRFCSIIL